MENPLSWFEIYVEDLTRAKAFYESMLDIELTKLDDASIDMLAFPKDFAAYGSTGALVKMEGFPPGGNSVLVYFNCDDCAIEARRAVDAGGRLQKPKTSVGPYGFIALVIDSEGNMVGLHSLK